MHDGSVGKGELLHPNTPYKSAFVYYNIYSCVYCCKRLQTIIKPAEKVSLTFRVYIYTESTLS